MASNQFASPQGDETTIGLGFRPRTILYALNSCSLSSDSTDARETLADHMAEDRREEHNSCLQPSVPLKSVDLLNNTFNFSIRSMVDILHVSPKSTGMSALVLRVLSRLTKLVLAWRIHADDHNADQVMRACAA
jgi:hypothetical protein